MQVKDKKYTWNSGAYRIPNCHSLPFSLPVCCYQFMRQTSGEDIRNEITIALNDG